MCLRKLYVFKHSDALGNCPAHVLLEKVKAVKKDDIVYPRSFGDYTLTVEGDIPQGVELIEML